MPSLFHVLYTRYIFIHHNVIETYKKLSYREQIVRKLSTQYVEGFYNSVTLKCGSGVVQGH